MITTVALPDWPPPADEPIGEDRARQYIAWIREHVGPLITDARLQLNERHPNAETHTSAVTVDQLAAWTLSDHLEGLSIGTVWASISGGTFAMIDIRIRRDGHLESRPGLNMRD